MARLSGGARCLTADTPCSAHRCAQRRVRVPVSSGSTSLLSRSSPSKVPSLMLGAHPNRSTHHVHTLLGPMHSQWVS